MDIDTMLCDKNLRIIHTGRLGNADRVKRTEIWFLIQGPIKVTS